MSSRKPFTFKKAAKGYLTLQAMKHVMLCFIGVALITVSYSSLHKKSVHLSPPKPVVTSRVMQTAPAQPKVVTPVAKPTPSPAPTPSLSTPVASPPTAAPAPAVPKPAVSASPQVVAQAQASPGKTVGSLAPTTNVTPPSPPSAPSASPSPTTPPPSPSSSPSTTTPTYTSTNWSGYFTSAHSYTGVSGSWHAPRPTGNGTSTSADATWIGIGGVNSQDLIQVGTENTVSSSGQVSNAVFYELLPAAPVYPITITITSGDSISASIIEVALNQWTIAISNKTTGQSFSTTVNYTSSHSSAEWIEEDPSYNNGSLVPFDNFGSASFTASTATYGNSTLALVNSSASAIDMVDSANKPIATPSTIGNDGLSFGVARN